MLHRRYYFFLALIFLTESPDLCKALHKTDESYRLKQTKLLNKKN